MVKGCPMRKHPGGPKKYEPGQMRKEWKWSAIWIMLIWNFSIFDKLQLFLSAGISSKILEDRNIGQEGSNKHCSLHLAFLLEVCESRSPPIVFLSYLCCTSRLYRQKVLHMIHYQKVGQSSCCEVQMRIYCSLEVLEQTHRNNIFAHRLIQFGMTKTTPWQLSSIHCKQ